MRNDASDYTTESVSVQLTFFDCQIQIFPQVALYCPYTASGHDGVHITELCI